MKNLKANLNLWGLGVLTSVYLIYGLLFQDAQGYVSVGNKILFTLVIAALALFLGKCYVWYSAFMLVGKKPFIKKVDRPRVFFFSIFYGWLLLIYFVFYQYMMIPLENSVVEDQFTEAYTGASVIVVISVTIFVLLIFTFSKKFERIYLPKLKKASQTLEGSKESPKKTMKKERVEKILENLIENDLMVLEDDREKEEEQKQKLIRLFTSTRGESSSKSDSKHPEEKIVEDIPVKPIVKLKIKNAIAVRCLFDYILKETDLFNMGELNKIFGNEEGVSFNYKTISSSITDARRRGTLEGHKKRVSVVFEKE